MSKSKFTVNLSRDEVMAHEIGPMLKENTKRCDLNIADFGHVATLYKKNPYRDGVDYLDTKFYNATDNIQLRTIFVDKGQQDNWVIRETIVDIILENDDG